MINKTLSIIVPVYNAERYLEKCLQSLCKLPMKDVEIIVINDGSKDSSSQILERYQDKLIIIEQENSGVSVARNNGVNYATGKYIMFVDADDLLYSSFELVVQKLKEGQITEDLIVYNYEEIDFNDNKICDVNVIQNLKDIKDVLCEYILGDYFNPCWGKIFKADIVKKNNICFPKGIKIGEDMIWLGNVLTCIKSFKCVNEYYYGYRLNYDGAMHTLRGSLDSNRIKEVEIEISIKKKLVKELNMESELNTPFLQKFSDKIIALVNHCINGDATSEEKKIMLNELINNEMVNEIITNAYKCKGVNFKRRVICFFMKRNVLRYIYFLIKNWGK